MSYTYAIAKRPRSHGFINDSDRVVCATLNTNKQK